MIRKLLDVFRGGPRVSLPFRPAAGQLLSVVTDDGGYGVMKLLAVDGAGVHARLYVQRFSAPPVAGDLTELTLAGFGPGHDNPFSIGHMPLSFQSFAGWRPQPIGEAVVASDELEGYHMWKEAKGGYF